MKIAVMDAQGAGLGKAVIKKLRKELGENIYIYALGTNSVATSNMIKEGANEGITGEESICNFCDSEKISSIVGPIGIISSGGILGEITPRISKSVFAMECTKYIMPLQKHGIYIPGTRDLKIKEIIDDIVLDISKHLLD